MAALSQRVHAGVSQSHLASTLAPFHITNHIIYNFIKTNLLDNYAFFKQILGGDGDERPGVLLLFWLCACNLRLLRFVEYDPTAKRFVENMQFYSNDFRHNLEQFLELSSLNDGVEQFASEREQAVGMLERVLHQD